MEPQEVVSAFYDALSTSGPDAAVAYLADDLAIEQPGAPVQGLEQWLAMQRMWRAGFPDVTITFDVEAVDRDMVRGRAHATGTLTGELDLGPLGLGTVAATGQVVTVETPLAWTIEGGKLVSATVALEEGTGVQGLLAQLGLTPPQR
jgi:hypothetical protein